MKIITALSACAMLCATAQPWSRDRLEHFLRGSCRFVESDYDDDDTPDIPARNRDALPLFEDVIRQNGWTTNDLVLALIDVASNGLTSVGWATRERRQSTAIAIDQLADINHPYVTNYFNSIATEDLHGLGTVVIPALFKYTHLEPMVMARLRELCIMTNRYDMASPIVAFDMLDCLDSMPDAEKPEAKMRVAKFMYFSMRHVSSSRTWQDEKLAVLIPSYSNSVQRLDQVRYFVQHATYPYERNKAQAQLDRLCSLPTNSLNDVSWIAEE